MESCYCQDLGKDCFKYEEWWFYNPYIQFIFTFLIAFLLSPFSMGFFVFLIIYILTEIYYWSIIGFKCNNSLLISRSLIFVGAIIGFVIGRIVFSNDYNPFRHSYHEYI